MTATAPMHVPGGKSPTLSRPSTSTLQTSAKISSASYLCTDTGQKQSIPTDEFLAGSTVEGAQFTIDENLLQLHLKEENFPYRILRCDVETDLEAGLQTYFELDVLDEHNKFMCDVCTAQRLEKRGIVLYSPH